MTKKDAQTLVPPFDSANYLKKNLLIELSFQSFGRLNCMYKMYLYTTLALLVAAFLSSAFGVGDKEQMGDVANTRGLL